MTMETQKPVDVSTIGPLKGAFQIMFRDAGGKLYVLQMTGDIRALLQNDAEGKHLRDALFWHMKAAFLSNAAAVLGMPPVEMEREPEKPKSNLIVAPN